MLRRLLLAWAFNIAAIFVASIFVDGVDYGSQFWVLIVAGFVFGLVNFFVKPIVKLFSLPVVFLTFGIALFLINILMLYITSWIVADFQIDSFMDAVWGSLIIWAVNAVLQAVFDAEDRGRAREQTR
jgi:putative membrane protein